MKAALPNILTMLRLGLTLVVFLGLIALAWPPGSFGGLGRSQGVVQGLYYTVLVGFVVAAVTDFFDGWLARKWNVVSTAGAILDPIADKVLVAGTIVGLSALAGWTVALPGGLILFREFSVSAMREVLAPKGLKLPVTTLAKWKTTLQLIALAAIIVVGGWRYWGLPDGLWDVALTAYRVAFGLMWAAVVVTLYTGLEYAVAARKALQAAG